MFEIFLTFDWVVLHWIHNTLTSPTLNFLMPKITALGNGGLVWVLVALTLIATKRYRRDGFILIVGLMIGVVVGNVFLKNLIARPRPCWIDHSITLSISNPTDYSFPSGHTLSSVIAATVLTMSNKRLGYIAIPMAFLISFSRLYLYVHFPSDVLGASIIGLIIGISTYISVNSCSFQRKRK